MSVSNIARQIIQNPVPAVATPMPQTLPSAPVDKNQLASVVDKVKKTIDALGDGLKALDISERESLLPMWGVLKEGLEILNGEPDDWDFSSTTTQDQLKQLSLMLNLHGQKFKGYINAEQQKQPNPPTNSADLIKLDNDIKALSRDIATIEELSAQIEAMWEDGSYREAGNEPYKLASRVALLSHLLGGGTVFNCKSGKDRTAQLDVEVKFLAFQIRTSNGKVPKPDRKRTNLEKIQFATFIFFDESRRKMQEFNTGYGGSKLVSQPALYGNFTPSTGDAKADVKNKAATIQ